MQLGILIGRSWNSAALVANAVSAVFHHPNCDATKTGKAAEVYCSESPVNNSLSTVCQQTQEHSVKLDTRKFFQRHLKCSIKSF
jgi:hypothetical protein